MTYNEINIWVFVIIEPVVFVWMAYYILRLRHRLKTYERDYPVQPVDQRTHVCEGLNLWTWQLVLA